MDDDQNPKTPKTQNPVSTNSFSIFSDFINDLKNEAPHLESILKN